MTSRQRPHLADIQEDETSDLGPVPATEKLIVAVRIRPLKSDEGERILHLLDDKSVLLDDEGEANKQDVLRQKRTGGKQYIYDFTFGENSTQEEVYEATTRGLVRDVLLGYNATVFAYGATGAGKTHTMVGTNASPGIMVRALNDLFNSIQPHGNQYQVSMSYLELYNENIRDLLNPSSGFLDLREDSHNSGRNVTVAGLTEVSTTSTQEVLSLLLRGNRERSVEPTGANKTSSRSHALLSVTVKRTTENKTSQAKLYMLDLAGSERASNTKNRGKRLVEGGHINRSLLALGNVINALSGSGRGGRYVNYRDSKLTRLLRQALSGNCRTVMVAHVSPASSHRDETRNTLVYAARANGITHKVEKNEMDVQFHVTQYRNIISDLRNEIGRLKEKIAEERPSSAEVRARATGTPVKQLREQIIATFREQMKLRRRLMDIDGHLLSLGVEAERQHQIISQWESRRGQLYSRGRTGSSRPNTQASQSDHGWLDGGELNVHQAWSELSYIEREQERYIALRSQTIRELDNCRQRAVALENELPGKLDSDTEREMLSLLIRVHELEADKVALQGERLVESHELRRRGDMLQRLQRQQRLTDDIITRQRHLMEENKIMLPPDLQDLYQLYQQEIHATTFSSESSLPSSLDQLPPIREGDSLFDRGGPVRPTSVLERIGTDTDNNRSSSGGSSSSEWDVTLPPLHQNSAIVMANIENNNSSTRTNGVSTRVRPSTMETSSVLFPPIVTQRNI